MVHIALPHPEPGRPVGERWRAELADAYASVEALVRDGLLSAGEAEALGSVAARYQIRIPRYYAKLFDVSLGAACPIRQQALPAPAEDDPTLPDWARAWSQQAFGRDTPWTGDPIGDLDKLAAPRLTHRYGNRAIVHMSTVCALYCRFCFRKAHLNDAERTLYAGSLTPALDYVRAHPEIGELILTGGDPLSLPDAWLGGFLAQLDAIPHLRHVRIHSRMPVTLPSRMTDGLATILTERRVPVALVAHFNHPRELTPLARQELERLRRRGVTLYNQSVLLRDINDRVAPLATLFQDLYDCGVTPFYLHHPDWTPGTFHFRVSIARGRAIMQALAGRLSGPALPHYVLDMPGGLGKTLLMGHAVQPVDARVTDDLCGALYRVKAPQTRTGGGHDSLYMDLWRPERPLDE